MGNKVSNAVTKEAYTNLSLEFDLCFAQFLEQNCIVAKDKYVPIKILIQAFTFYLKNTPIFMEMFTEYNALFTPKFASVDHLVHLWIYNSIKAHELTLSSGFSSAHNNISTRRRDYYYYNYFIDERTVIGLSVERFQKV